MEAEEGKVHEAKVITDKYRRKEMFENVRKEYGNLSPNGKAVTILVGAFFVGALIGIAASKAMTEHNEKRA